MKQIETTFNWKIRKTVDGKLNECDIYINIVEPKKVSEYQRLIHQPYIDNPIEHVGSGATTEDILAITERNEATMKKIEGEVMERLTQTINEVWSTKNKDFTAAELVEVFKSYPVIFNKFLLKWHEVCLKQTFLGLELDKDMQGN